MCRHPIFAPFFFRFKKKKERENRSLGKIRKKLNLKKIKKYIHNNNSKKKKEGKMKI